MLALLTGLLAGAVHVLTGPDHLAAVAPLSVKAHRRGWIAGFRWGLGHSAGVCLVGVLALATRRALPLELISSWSERFIGVVLLGVGLWSLRAALRVQVHAHTHTHDGQLHEHIHLHGTGHSHGGSGGAGSGHSHAHAAFGIGALHGLAGSSHFFGVLPSLALPTTAEALVYLAAFAVGTMAAMAGFASALGWVAQRFVGSAAGFYRGLMMACALAAFSVGGWWMFRI